MKVGVQFRAIDGNEVSTSDAGRRVVGAALATVDPKKADAVRSEKNWRQGYAKHFTAMTQLAATSPKAALDISQAALDAFTEQFVFVGADGSQTELRDAVRQAVEIGSTTFGSVYIHGVGRDIPPLRVPYHGMQLEGAALIKQANIWVNNAIIDPSAGRALIELCNHTEWMDLRGKHFVVLGAASQMGPTEKLLEYGATVYAIDLPKRPAVWARLIAKARKSPGTLVVPVAGGSDAAVLAETAGDEAIAGAAGCDLLKDAPSIAAWCAACAPGCKMTLGSYVYLDGALFARVAAACDTIVSAVAEFRGGEDAPAGVRLAHLLSPTEVHAVPKAVRDEAVRRHSKITPSTLWEKPVNVLSGGRLLAPNEPASILQSASDVEPLYVQDFLVPLQGPNYALAKTLQKCRAVVARANGHLCSATVGPATLTESITHNQVVAAGLLGARHFGIEPFEISASSALLAAMLLWDLHAPAGENYAHPATQLKNPLEVFMQNACHGGAWTCSVKFSSTAEVCVVLHVLSKTGKFIVGAGALAAAVAATRRGRARRSKL